MIIIPSRPYKTNSSAEYRLFKKLQESFSGDNSYIAFHSLNLTHHESKRFGEADFVILCRYGLFVLEVKGGGVSYKDGHWFTINRDKDEFKIQDPFRQAEGALHALRDKIKENFPAHLSLPIGYGVILPDAAWNIVGSEWSSKTICDSHKFRNIESWLRVFFRYWQAKPHNCAELTDETIKQLKAFIRPDFELIEPLHHRLDRLSNQAVTLTNDQYKYLDIVAANKRVLCSGGAGTGKTFLAAELARRLANENCNVVLVCKSSWLRYYLQSKIVNNNVTISTIDSLTLDRKRAGIDLYDVLLVDEGQDLFDFDSIDSIESNLVGGLEQGEWYIFHDVNNQSGLFVNTKIEILKLLESYSPVRVPLVTNCRNTLSIIETVKSRLSLDMGGKGTGHGPKVEFLFEDENQKPALQLEKKLVEILKSGVPAHSITILSSLPYKQSNLEYVQNKLRNQIIELDDYSIRNFPIENISFSEIKNFKGLENEVIFVIDLPEPCNETAAIDKVLHYVAMTRARALLCVFWAS